MGDYYNDYEQLQDAKAELSKLKESFCVLSSLVSGYLSEIKELASEISEQKNIISSFKQENKEQRGRLNSVNFQEWEALAGDKSIRLDDTKN